MGLKEVLYDEPYENASETINYDGFVLEDTIMLDDMITIEDKQDIQALFHMTPYYWKTSRNAVEKLEKVTNLKTEIQFQIEIYRRK